MEQIRANDPQFWGDNDTQTIQNAVDHAEKEGIGQVIIPRINSRTGKAVWKLPKAVLLPSDMTVILEGSHLRHADNTIDNLFRNKLCWTQEGKTQQGEQHDIRIIGNGNAVIEGGKDNGRCEQLLREELGKHLPMVWDCAIHFSNVRHFEVRGIRFVQTRYWALCFHYCRWGQIRELDFHSTGLWENQDGIDLRVGCEYITVQDITGVTGDDTIALTALPNSSAAVSLRPAGKTVDIHDIIIRNITASTHGCGVLRLLCEDGARLYNVTADGIQDTTGSISGTSVIVGTPDPTFCSGGRKMGHMKNIILRNITTCAQRGITLSEQVQDMVIENLFTYGPTEVGLRFTGNFSCDNLFIRNITVRGQKDNLKAVFSVTPNPEGKMKALKIENIRASGAQYIFAGAQLPAENLEADTPLAAWFTPDVPVLPSAYGRYHYAAYGTVLTNRPPDNRFDGTLKTPEELAE